jgi:transglutaminase-like putative cysteine protease
MSTPRFRIGPDRRLRYEVRNGAEVARAAYLALPVDGPDQVVVSCVVEARGPDGPVQWQRVEQLDHVAAVVTLPPSGRLRVTARVRPLARSMLGSDIDGHDAAVDERVVTVLEPQLSMERRTHFLRHTALTALDTESVEQAHTVAGSGTPVERVKRMFDHLTDGPYRYEWPPPDRGATGLLRTGAGDCGDFTFLLVAWCRALGIPARSVVGGWAQADDAAHVWAEFHLEGIGWVPVDVSVALLLRREPDRFAVYGVGPDPEAHFGSLVGDRVVFARDVATRLPDDIVTALQTEQAGAPPAEVAPGLVIAGRPFRWGIDTLAGTVPYLQPGFIVGLPDEDIGWRVRYAGATGALKTVHDVAGIVFGLSGATSLAWLLFDPPTPQAVRVLTALALTVFLISGLLYRRYRKRVPRS